MTFFHDLLSLLVGCVALNAAFNREGLITAAVVGIILGALCWVACAYYSRLWNRSYRVTLISQIFCGIAAILTVIFTIIFCALSYTRQAAYVSVEAWQVQLIANLDWKQATFDQAYSRVRSLGLESFVGIPTNQVPLQHPESITTMASTYAEAAAKDFERSRPFLSEIVHAKTEVPAELIDADAKRFFAAGGTTYPAANGIALAAGAIKANLREQLPRVVTIFRMITVGLFLIAQTVPFGLVGFAAFHNLKVET